MGKVTTFTPEEIAELEKKPSEVAREKIAATGSKEALEAFDQIVGMFNGVHDGYLMQCNAAVSGLYKEVGPEKYLEYMHDYFYNATAPYMQGYWDKPFKERALIAINAPRMFHDCNMKILGEDDEKLWFVMDPCGAGQKLWDMGPVSYTHLDVYKRQVQGMRVSYNRDNTGKPLYFKASGVHELIDRELKTVHRMEAGIQTSAN